MVNHIVDKRNARSDISTMIHGYINNILSTRNIQHIHYSDPIAKSAMLDPDPDPATLPLTADDE